MFFHPLVVMCRCVSVIYSGSRTVWAQRTFFRTDEICRTVVTCHHMSKNCQIWHVGRVFPHLDNIWRFVPSCFADARNVVSLYLSTKCSAINSEKMLKKFLRNFWPEKNHRYNWEIPQHYRDNNYPRRIIRLGHLDTDNLLNILLNIHLPRYHDKISHVMTRDWDIS